MLNAKFNHKEIETIIQCKKNEKMKQIIHRFKEKVETDKVYYLYNGNKINENLRIEEIINEEDNKNSKINILVCDIEEKVNKNIIESNEMICPICYENKIIKLEDYKIEMKCNNNHKNILLIKDYNNKIDISKIKCIECNKNRSEIYNNEFYICLKCNINLCPLCKLKHDNNHDIINYESKNYKCNKHNENYTKYCCNKNICIECENEHSNHKSIYYGNILPNINENNIKEYIDKFSNEIRNIITRLNDIIKDMEKYYNIYNNIIKIYNKKRKNYEILQNINEFINYNKIVIKDINEIINEEDINNKFKNIMHIYDKMNNINNKKDINNINNNYIIGQIEIEEEDKDIRIINSYDNFCEENKWAIEDKYKNEKEMEENIEIRINDKIIPFCYFYKFKKGKHTIKYIFKKKSTKLQYMFSKCKSLTSINLSNFNTQNATNMWCMFSGCESLTTINLSNINTQNVTYMRGMFYGCKSLVNINLSDFNTQNVTDMGFMFYGCESLTNINLSNINTQNVTYMDSMFTGCKSLTKNNITTNNNKILNQFK